MTNSLPGALSGLTIIDLSRLLPGPYCSMVLADHGARVIAIEDKRFVADGLFMTTVNRNKEHVSLNLKTEQGREIFFRMVRQADVVLEGFRPGVVDRLGIGYSAVSAVNPAIVYCSITGYGQNGPYRDRVGHDVNYLSMAGVLDLIGRPEDPPTIPGIQLADIAGGGMNAVIGILLALLARNQTGKGQYIDISMTDGVLGFLCLPLFFERLTGQPFRRGDAILSHRYACYNTYQTADGRFLSIGAVENRFWKRLCDHLEVPAFAPLQYDDNRREEITAHMRACFLQKTLAQWEEELGDLDVCWAPVQQLDEVLKSTLFREREVVVEQRDPDGVIRPTLGIPVKLSATPGSVRTPPVSFGASTKDVLKELGYTDDDIDRFFQDGVV